ncbi:hypothetical protein J6N69_02655 [bacterium]|nr:hypothetical protein [bacterium]
MFGFGMSTYGNLTNASMAHIPFMAFNPYGMTNFGGDIQIFPVEPYRQTQVGLMFNPVAQMMGWPAGLYEGGGCGLTPQINMNSVIARASAMAAQCFNSMASQNINSALQAIAGQKAKIQSQLQADDLKAEDKKKLEEQLKQLEEYEKQINELKTSSLDPKSVYAKTNELQKAINDTIAGKPTKTEAQGSQQSSQSQSSQSQPSQSQPSQSSQSPESQKPESSQDEKVKPSSFTSWVDDMANAIWGAGTGDYLEQGCSEITKDDVIERMVQWNKIHPEESFMEAFMGDAGYDQKRTYGRHILNQIRNKALELGIDLSKDKDYLACMKVMNGSFSWAYIDNSVADNYNALIKKVAKKMGYNYEYTPYSMMPKS